MLIKVNCNVKHDKQKKYFSKLHAEFKFRVTPRNALKGNELRVNEL